MADKKLYEVVKIEHFNSFSVRISGKHSIIMKILGDVIVAITAIARIIFLILKYNELISRQE